MLILGLILQLIEQQQQFLDIVLAGAVFLILPHSSRFNLFRMHRPIVFYVPGFRSFTWNCSHVRLTKFTSCTTLVEVSPSQSLSCSTRTSEEYVKFAHLACQVCPVAYVLDDYRCVFTAYPFPHIFWRSFRMLIRHMWTLLSYVLCVCLCGPWVFGLHGHS